MLIEDESEKRGENGEIEELPPEKVQEEVLEVRTRIIDGLNKSGEVQDVSDLFVKPLPHRLFNPIVFKLHIPLSLQKTYYVDDESIRAEIEDFEVVYDSSIVMVVAFCDVDKLPFGVFDVRDRLAKIFELFGKIRIVPPCLSPVAVTFLRQGDSEKIKSESLFVSIQKPTDSKVLVRELYVAISDDLDLFFEACSVANDIAEEIEEIERCVSRLLGNLHEFLRTDWKHIRKKWNIVSQNKKEMAKILEKLTRYTSDQNLLKRNRKDINTFIIKGAHASAKLINKIGLDWYTEPYSTLDTNSVINIVEHVRSEIETLSLNRSTLFSALLGAAIGSVITLVASLL